MIQIIAWYGNNCKWQLEQADLVDLREEEDASSDNLLFSFILPNADLFSSSSSLFSIKSLFHRHDAQWQSVNFIKYKHTLIYS